MAAALRVERRAQVQRFAVVGVAGTLVFYALLWTLVEAAHIAVMTSTSIAFLAVVAQNYVLHRLWTFRSATPHRRALPRFLLMSATGFWVNGAVMALGVQRLGLNYLSVQAVAIGVVVACNFIGTSWIFRRRPRVRHVFTPGGADDGAR